VGQVIALQTSDGAAFKAWHRRPLEARRGAIVLLHAIWGVTPHLRALAEDLATSGYEVLVPSLLDGTQPFPEQDLDPSALARRMDMGAAAGWGLGCLPIVQSCIDRMPGPVFVMGFCFGGTTAWHVAAGCTGVSAVSCFYGGHIRQFLDSRPACPTILHFGRTDETIPAEDVEAVKGAFPDLPIWMYDAGHAFVAPSGFHADSARLSMLRSLQLFQRQGGLKPEA
jgi:carboxymethylenebutenolidase